METFNVGRLYRHGNKKSIDLHGPGQGMMMSLEPRPHCDGLR